MSRLELDTAYALYDLSTEIASQLLGQPDHISEPRLLSSLADPQRDEGAVQYPFALSRMGIYEGTWQHSPTTPAFELTRRTLAFATFRGDPLLPLEGDLHDTGCSEAELWFAASLARHRTRGRQRPHPERCPAIIYRDIDGNPCAYQKGEGLPTAYVWRDATVRVADGSLRRIPEESIVNFDHEGTSEENLPRPEQQYLGHDIVVVENGWHPLDVEFVRFTAATLPPIIRGAMLRIGLRRQPQLKRHSKAADGLTAQRVGQEVGRLLAHRQVLPIGDDRPPAPEAD